jgi:antitoxin (DNA-binding transcriptional repressor) of toxin-antitoxin stability system
MHCRTFPGSAMIPSMEPLRISEQELASNLRALLQRVENGAEIIIERADQPVAILRAPALARRRISECIALMPAGSTAVLDSAFAADVDAAIAAHRDSLEPPDWD